MEEAGGASYWCHMCSQIVNPIMEVELKCPFCLSGFVEEMDSTGQRRRLDESDLTSDRALALWAPILLGMMGNPRNRRRFRRHFLDENNGDDDNENENGERLREGETELDREVDSIIRRRRRRSSAILQLLQGISAGISAELENAEYVRGRERERVILVNPFNQSILVQGSDDSNQDQNVAQNPFGIGSLGDYFIGPGLDMLLQHMAENDPNRYGTLPAQKEAVDALPTVKVEDNLQCAICLDDFEPAAEVKEMPCKHKFHTGCLLPWLELHSSCPVCRFQLPADESKCEPDMSGSSSNNGSSDNHHGSGYVRDMEERGGGESPFTLPWFLNVFTSSSSSRGSSSLSQSSSPASSSGGPGATSQADGN